MSFTAEQKSQLAKLMATENLTVQHQKLQTAKFDPKNRILYLPIWQNMSGYMYDLLCGHEVGHALYTPAEGWHDAVTDESKNSNFKSFLNVVEDARIEKKVKRRYPGLRSSFQQGYKELMAKDFFGLKGRDINQMSFIDRLNLFTKSQYTASWIDFTAYESTLIRKVENLETWEDVLRVANEIYEYSKTEQAELQSDGLEIMVNGLSDDGDEYDQVENDSSENDGDDGEESDEKQKKSSSKKTDEDGDQEDDEAQTSNRHKNSSESYEDQFSPNCETDDNYRRNESMLVDEKCRDYQYADLPKPILENIVTPAKTVHQYLTTFFNSHTKPNQYFSQPRYSESDMTKWVNEFKHKNERYIGLLAKEFEMRKAAKAFSKSKLSDTGDIDVNKLASYKFDDNIFRKVMLTPKGKNHGLILLLDKSGSMSQNMPGSIEQILVLAMFCRKVNIPVIVYGFGDAVDVRRIDTNKTPVDFVTEKTFTQNVGEVSFSNVYLREYLNSNMSNVEFNRAVKNLIMIKKSFEDNGRYYSQVPRPDTEHLSNTPLTQAIVAVGEIMKDFKSKNNLDLTSLVIVHDGDADWINSHNQEVEVKDYESLQTVKKIRPVNLDTYNSNVIIQDKKNKFQRKMVDNRSSMNTIVLDWFKQTTGSKVFGFYLAASKSQARNAIEWYYVDEKGVSINEITSKYGYHESRLASSALNKKLNAEKFIESKTPGYDAFYIVAGGKELETEEEQIEIQGNVTASKLKTAFMKFNKKKSINRVLVSRFISGIAA
jgi:hypothetical protein